MKRIDFEHGTVTGNILGAALPMLVAQILSLLYNIVDRVYIGVDVCLFQPEHMREQHGAEVASSPAQRRHLSAGAVFD